MTKLSITEPELGTKNSIADPRIPAALKEIEKVVNGELEGTNNFKAEGVLEGNLSKALQEKLTTKLGLTMLIRNVSFTAVSENIYQQSKTGATCELPAPTTNRMVGLIAGGGCSSCKMAASSGKIYGGLVVGQTTITLTELQTVIVEADGTNWWIIAGEPKREQEYSGLVLKTKAEAEAGISFSVSRPAQVSLYPTEVVAGEVIEVGGKQAAVASSSSPSVTVFVPPGQTLKAKKGLAVMSILL